MVSPYNSQDMQQGINIDAGLRSYMQRVYNWMALALVLTGGVAYGVSSNLSIFKLFFYNNMSPTALGWIAMIAPLAFVFVLSFGVNKLSSQAAQALFLLYSAVMGISLSILTFVYTGGSVARAFFISAALYAAMSIWGYITKKSLASFGSFLFMGIIGIFIASIINIWLHSSQMELVISVLGVLLFTGFTAYDTQRIKMNYQVYLSSYPPEEVNKRTVVDALALYLDFINLFQFILQLTGVGKNND